jgi:acyl-CoA synthetase (AMP-forming)/AMP-acid ligase II
MNTTDFLNIASAICPDRELMVFQDKRWTFEQTNERVDRLANALTGLGIGKGDRVGILLVNCYQYVEAYFALAKIGAIMVPLNFRAKADELGYMLANAETKLLFVGARYLDMIEKMLPDLPSVEKCVSVDEEIEGTLFYENLIASGSPEEVYTEIDDEDITILMYTAGTTGRPKGVPLKHSGFVSYILDSVEPANPEIEERNLLTEPRQRSPRARLRSRRRRSTLRLSCFLCGTSLYKRTAMRWYALPKEKKSLTGRVSMQRRGSARIRQSESYGGRWTRQWSEPPMRLT